MDETVIYVNITQKEKDLQLIFIGMGICFTVVLISVISVIFYKYRKKGQQMEALEESKK